VKTGGSNRLQECSKVIYTLLLELLFNFVYFIATFSMGYLISVTLALRFEGHKQHVVYYEVV
jgi:hypothetical protein